MGYANAETHAVSSLFGVDKLDLFPDGTARIVSPSGDIDHYDNHIQAKMDFYELTGHSA